MCRKGFKDNHYQDFWWTIKKRNTRNFYKSKKKNICFDLIKTRKFRVSDDNKLTAWPFVRHQYNFFSSSSETIKLSLEHFVYKFSVWSSSVDRYSKQTKNCYFFLQRASTKNTKKNSMKMSWTIKSYREKGNKK